MAVERVMVLEYECTRNCLVEELNNVGGKTMMDLKLMLWMLNPDHMLYMNEDSMNMDVVVVAVDDDDRIVRHKRVQIEQQQHIVHRLRSTIELLDC